MQILLATLASTMTIYLSSSAHHTTSKDSTFLIPQTAQSEFRHSFAQKSHENGSGTAQHSPTRSGRSGGAPSSEETERQPLLEASTSSVEPLDPEEIVEPPRKIMYYAAGSGIPEIKTILSGESWNAVFRLGGGACFSSRCCI